MRNTLTITRETHLKLFEKYHTPGKAYPTDFVTNSDGTVTFEVEDEVWNVISSIATLMDVEPEQIIREGLGMKLH